MAQIMSQIDLLIIPSLAGDGLLLTNLTGHPAVVIPNGFSAEGAPRSSVTLVGCLFDESTILSVAERYQQATDFHLRQPEMSW